jgi:branched-chain amino acid transport system substrate-binding protein
MKRRTLLTGIGAGTLTIISPRSRAETVVGVTNNEIKIGHTIAYSGPASAYGVIGHSHTAFFKRVNDQGGVGGRKINFISYDDAYSPPKTVEQVRRLVEQDQVACLFATLGTPTNSAIHKYCNDRKVPQLFVATGAEKWADPKHFPWTIGWQPSYQYEAHIYAKYMLQQNPNPKIAVLYQNDDFGKDYVVGLKAQLGANYKKFVVKEASYEATDATIDSQTVSMKDAGADVLVCAGLPKFAAQLIRKVYDLNWKPMFFMTNVSISVAAVMKPAGPEKGVGIISSLYLKDQTDPAWANDALMNEWRQFMKDYIPNGDLTDGGYPSAYAVAQTMLLTLQQCAAAKDFSRESIMRQATSIKNEVCATLLPGITVNDSATDFHPVSQVQLAKWDGNTWARFGEVMSGGPTA